MAAIILSCIVFLCLHSVNGLNNVFVHRRYNSLATKNQYLTPKTQKFYVNGTSIPQVSFDVGESYAGLILANNATKLLEQQKMFFWFFPTVNPAGKDDIVIWFNGGPGCSSMEGFLQENGPFSWKPGTFLPTANAYSWHKLANVIWVEYPVGTGFSTGPITARSDADAAQQFIVFWKNFVQTFGLFKKRIFITGESYAGLHVPYVANAMFAENDPLIYNVTGALMYDAVLPKSYNLSHDQRSMPAYLRYWGNLFPIPSSVHQEIEQINQDCGLDAYLNKYLAYPPPPVPFPGLEQANCDVVTPFFSAVGIANPCFNPYHVSDTCPIQWDTLGYPNFPYTPKKAHLWFNQDDVRRAIHVPTSFHKWAECQSPVFVGNNNSYNDTDFAIKSQSIIEKTNNTMIGSGLLDLVIPPNVTALAIQMLEWNGLQGFQTAPSEDFLLPPVQTVNVPNIASGGYAGSTHTERGLTHVTINLSGHMVPQYAPSASFRHLEVLLGRIQNLASGVPYSVNISTKFSFPY